jgi:transcriptional regulator with XRE-family HTH domain
MSGARDSVLVEAFSEVVREARIAAKMTQEQLAHEALVDRTYVGLLENAKRQPTLSVIFSIAGSLGVTPETLIKRTRDRAARIGLSRS